MASAKDGKEALELADKMKTFCDNLSKGFFSKTGLITLSRIFQK